MPTSVLLPKNLFRILLTLLLLAAVGLSACGRRGGLDRPKGSLPQIKADPQSKMQNAPDRHLWIDRLIE